jgi:carbon-monoxide dehydrogenase medium subunit
MPTLAPFELHRVTSVADASGLIEELGEDAVFYSGGTELLLLMKLGFADYQHLIDVKPIEELGRLEIIDGALMIGGAVTHRTLERSGLVQSGWPELVEMERNVANVRVRATGSLGGNLAFADPHSDPATFLLAAGASVHIGGAGPRRRLRLEQFVRGPYETALDRGELVCAVEVPALHARTGMAHERFAIHERPTATVTAWVRLGEDGRIEDTRVAVGSVGIVPVLTPEADTTLAGADAKAIGPDRLAALGALAANASQPVDEHGASAEYKQALVHTLVGRAIKAAAARAAARPGSLA